MAKKILLFIFILIIIGVAFVSLKNIFLKSLIEQHVEESLGVKINIRKLDASLLNGNLRIEGLTIENPPGFQKKEFAYIPLINIYLSPAEYLRTKRTHFFILILDIERLNIVKNQDGEINLKKFAILQRKEDLSRPSLLIDFFKLNFNDVYYIEYLPNGKHRMRRYSVDIKDVTFGNVNSFEDVTKLVVLKVISQTDLGKIINISIAPLAEDTKDIMLVTGKTIKDMLKGVLAFPFSLFQKSKNAPQ